MARARNKKPLKSGLKCVVVVVLFVWLQFATQIAARSLGGPGTGLHPRPLPPPSNSVELYPESDEMAGLEEDGADCLLGNATMYLEWWVDGRGRLKRSLTYESSAYLDLSDSGLSEDDLYKTTKNLVNKNVLFVSFAYNDLRRVPREALQLVSTTVRYLSLTGNIFKSQPDETKSIEIQEASLSHFLKNLKSGWATFPSQLPKLRELDLSKCGIMHLDSMVFKAMPNLEKLFMPHNQLTFIASGAFFGLSSLIHLDLSHNIVLETKNNQSSSEDFSNEDAKTFESYMQLMQGLILPSKIFSQLTHLTILDMSRTKIHPVSAMAILFVGTLGGFMNLNQVSLCYTSLSILADRMFYKTSIQVLDISGNPSLSTGMTDNSLAGIEDKLEVLSFENSYVKQVTWLKRLTKLRILKMANNNLNYMPNDTFQYLKELEILDLSGNHISHWYEPIFSENDFKVLDLRSNNINILTTEMINDFQHVNYLAVGKNNFICSCVLKDFLALATHDPQGFQCKPLMPETMPDNLATGITKSNAAYNVFKRVFNEYINPVNQSTENLRKARKSGRFRNYRIYRGAEKRDYNGVFCNTSRIYMGYLNDLAKRRKERVMLDMEMDKEEIDDDEYLTFSFRLIDYDDDNYTCMNANSTIAFQIATLDHCTVSDSYSMPLTPPFDITIVYPLIIGAAFLVCFFVYWYRGYDIRYCCVVIRNATILSLMDKERRDLLRNKPEEGDFTYDVFVSYSEPDREWVMEEFLPNVERRDEITVCLHERDFQVGATILENIISSIDKSKCIVLVVSESFLKSNWCQFELHLAQHRLLETCRERLILVLLERIPRLARPRTLQYLMRTKTYIEWPTQKNFRPRRGQTLAEERKVFWRRLKKSIIEGHWEPERN